MLSAAQIGATTVGLANSFGRLCKRNLPAIPASFTKVHDVYIYMRVFLCMFVVVCVVGPCVDCTSTFFDSPIASDFAGQLIGLFAVLLAHT